MKTSENENTSDDVCEDCGAVVMQGKTGCLKIFEEIIAREFSDYRYGKIHRLTVDVYSLQHPDAYMRQGKSFAAHLTGICAALEYEDALAHYPERDEDADGSSWMLSILDGDPLSYLEFAKSYYEKSVDIEAVRHIFEHRPLTEEIVKGLNANRSLQDLSEDIEGIGYPSGAI